MKKSLKNSDFLNAEPYASLLSQRKPSVKSHSQGERLSGMRGLDRNQSLNAMRGLTQKVVKEEQIIYQQRKYRKIEKYWRNLGLILMPSMFVIMLGVNALQMNSSRTELDAFNYPEVISHRHKHLGFYAFDSEYLWPLLHNQKR